MGQLILCLYGQHLATSIGILSACTLWSAIPFQDFIQQVGKDKKR
jgi:hypothetical protein